MEGEEQGGDEWRKAARSEKSRRTGNRGKVRRKRGREEKKQGRGKRVEE